MAKQEYSKAEKKRFVTLALSNFLRAVQILTKIFVRAQDNFQYVTRIGSHMFQSKRALDELIGAVWLIDPVLGSEATLDSYFHLKNLMAGYLKEKKLDLEKVRLSINLFAALDAELPEDIRDVALAYLRKAVEGEDYEVFISLVESVQRLLVATRARCIRVERKLAKTAQEKALAALHSTKDPGRLKLLGAIQEILTKMAQEQDPA